MTIKKRALLLLIPGLFSITLFSCGSGEKIKLEVDEELSRVRVTAGGELFTDYRFETELEKPILYPLAAPGGIIVTRGYPLEPRENERVDHPHQVGSWFNFGNVNGFDFWNNSYAIGAGQKVNYGRIVHQEIVRTREKRGEALLEVKMSWIAPDTKDARTLLEEHTTFHFRQSGEVRIIDRITRLTAVGQQVTFSDNKEGLMAIRVDRAFELPSEAPEIYTDASGNPSEVPQLNNEGVTGWYTNSDGIEGNEAWGKRAEWVKLTGRKEGVPCTIVLIDHTRNPGHPPCWHARGYGLFAVNNMGTSVFNSQLEPFKLQLDEGETVVFRHRLIIAAKDLGEDEIEALKESFISEE